MLWCECHGGGGGGRVGPVPPLSLGGRLCFVKSHSIGV